MFRVCGHFEFTLCFCTDTVLCHDPGNTSPAARITMVVQFFGNSRAAIGLAALLMNDPDCYFDPSFIPK